MKNKDENLFSVLSSHYLLCIKIPTLHVLGLAIIHCCNCLFFLVRHVLQVSFCLLIYLGILLQPFSLL